MLHVGVYVLQDAPFDEILRRVRIAEESGFDSVWVADHLRDFRDAGGDWLDGSAVLAALSRSTSRIRLGLLVANPVLRPPATLARQALTLDHLSEGRFELGIGTGIAPFDYAGTGAERPTAKGRGERFAEYVQIVDGLLRSHERPFALAGRFYSSAGLSLRPPPVRRPRPHITLGGQSAAVRRMAVELADGWNTHGPFGAERDEIVEITRRQNAELDRGCRDHGRNPASLRRSLLCFGPLDPWATRTDPRELVEQFRAVGMTEFVFCWPPEDGVGALLEIASEP